MIGEDITRVRCDECDREFATLEQLEEHNRTQHPEFGYIPGFRCPACGAEFETLEQLETHEFHVHSLAA